MLLPLVAGGNSEAASVNADGTVNIDFWYAAAVTEAGPIPEDWVGYDIIRAVVQCRETFHPKKIAICGFYDELYEAKEICRLFGF